MCRQVSWHAIVKFGTRLSRHIAEFQLGSNPNSDVDPLSRSQPTRIHLSSSSRSTGPASISSPAAMSLCPRRSSRVSTPRLAHPDVD